MLSLSLEGLVDARRSGRCYGGQIAARELTATSLIACGFIGPHTAQFTISELRSG
jgi:hypothetical protein